MREELVGKARAFRNSNEHRKALVHNVLKRAHITAGQLDHLMADFAAQQHSAAEVRWVPIRAEDDLPKEDGDYLWLRRDDPDNLPVPHVFVKAKPWLSLEAIVRVCKAYLPIPPYTDNQEGDKPEDEK